MVMELCPRDPRQCERIASALGKHGQCSVAQAIKLKALPARLYRAAVPLKIISGHRPLT
jgi:hypothetical protein